MHHAVATTAAVLVGLAAMEPAAAVVTVALPGVAVATFQTPGQPGFRAVLQPVPPPSGAIAAARAGAAVAAPAPEPFGWAMMMVGFAVVGLTARWRRPAEVTA